MDIVRKAKLILASLLMIGSISLGYTSLAVAAPKDDVCAGVSLTGGTCAGSANNSISSIIRTAIQILSFVAGVAAVIMIIVGGFKYITSGGDSSNLQSAKNSIIYAIVGLVVVALAQFIVHFVLGKV